MIQSWPHNPASTNEFPLQKRNRARRAATVTAEDNAPAAGKSQGLAWLTENAPEDLVGVDRVLLEKTLQCLMLSMTGEAPVVMAAVATALRTLDQEAQK